PAVGPAGREQRRQGHGAGCQRSPDCFAETRGRVDDARGNLVDAGGDPGSALGSGAARPVRVPAPGGSTMSAGQGYVLGQSARAARRLEIQDAHFAAVSERLLDELALRPHDRVVEFGCGPGGFSRRILRRLGAGGVLVGVDSSEGLLIQARQALDNLGPAKFEPVATDVSTLGPWLDGADVVIARTVLHHVPMVEFLLG